MFKYFSVLSYDDYLDRADLHPPPTTSSLTIYGKNLNIKYIFVTTLFSQGRSASVPGIGSMKIQNLLLKHLKEDQDDTVKKRFGSELFDDPGEDVDREYLDKMLNRIFFARKNFSDSFPRRYTITSNNFQLLKRKFSKTNSPVSSTTIFNIKTFLKS